VAQLQAHGLTVSTPAGWEGRIFRRPAAGDLLGTSTDGAVAGTPAPLGELVQPVLHVATIPLAPDVADYASDAVAALGALDALVVLKEFDPSEAAAPLFRADGLPRDLDPDWFDPSSLQRTLPGQAGMQRFFQSGGRAFCLYVVLGSFARRYDVVPGVNQVLATLTIDPLNAPTPTTPTTTAPTTTTPAAPTTTVPTTTVPTKTSQTTTGPTTTTPATTSPATTTQTTAGPKPVPPPGSGG
jgi:hypothetical protein